ncbi:MAG: DUF4923 family protein [Alistipes sp.]|nr:DUF4923 family protein [Alistipes sp.]
MRRLIITLLMVVATVAMPHEAMAQLDLSKAFGALFGSASQQSQPTQPKTPLQLIAESAPSARDIAATWRYQSVGAEYLGVNQLAAFALTQAEPYIEQALRAEGITSGAFKLQMRRNGTAVVTTEDSSGSGRYAYDEATGAVTISITVNDTKVSCGGYIKLAGGLFTVLLNARDAVDAFVKVSPKYATDQTVLMIKEVLNNLDGAYIAVRFTK